MSEARAETHAERTMRERLEESISRVGAMQRCPVCTRVVDPPAPCAFCGGAVRMPPHEEWPKVLKMWVLWRSVRRRFASIYRRTEQATWEMLLRDEFVLAGGQHRNPYGTRITSHTPAADLYPLASRLAEEWRADGYPLDVSLEAQLLKPKDPTSLEGSDDDASAAVHEDQG